VCPSMLKFRLGYFFRNSDNLSIPRPFIYGQKQGRWEV
jgi:hypothetical protein